MSIEKSINKAYRTALEREWDTIYVLVDVHDTISESNYKDTEVKFFPEAIEALKILSTFKEIYLVLWTCCHEKDYDRYLNRFNSLGVNFKSVNFTPVQNTLTGCFDKKPYFSVLIDDKAGFDPDEWPSVVDLFSKARTHYIKDRKWNR